MEASGAARLSTSGGVPGGDERRCRYGIAVPESSSETEACQHWRGYSEDDVRNIAHGNAIRFWERRCPNKHERDGLHCAGVMAAGISQRPCVDNLAATAADQLVTTTNDERFAKSAVTGFTTMNRDPSGEISNERGPRPA